MLRWLWETAIVIRKWMRAEVGCCTSIILTRYSPSLYVSYEKMLTLIQQTVLFLFCLFNETFFIALYLLSFSSLLSPSILGAGTENASSSQLGNAAPVSASSIFTDPYSAGALELARANKLDDFWPFVIAIVSCPVMVGKQVLNGIQLVKAARWLGEGDRAARRKAGLPRPKVAAA
jgi:CDP-diacylglycerol--inositol 3-phosphatidyltransferase